MMVLYLAMLHAATQPETAPTDQGRVAHPYLPCWTTERAWTPSGEEDSVVLVFDTQDDIRPDSIEHNVDQILEGRDVVQNYNFIDYRFANGGSPLLARTYLDEPGSVEIRFGPETLPRDADEARSLIAPEILCYLQKRFRTVTALTALGYARLWKLD